MSEKLTKPQLELLKETGTGCCSVSETYAPAKKLVARGYAVWSTTGKYGSTYLDITPAGRAALSEQSP